MAKYLVCGNVMIDQIIQNNYLTTSHLGGPAAFALAGIKMFCDDVKIVCNIGNDYQNNFASFFYNNNCDLSGLTILDKPTLRSYLSYQQDGSYNWQADENLPLFEFKFNNLINNIDSDSKAIYLFMYPKDDFFNHINQLKQKHNFKIMWEYGSFAQTKLEDSFEELKYVDYFSLNRTDASAAFNTDKFDDLANIRIIQQLPVKYTYYRVGDKGAYLISKDFVYFCPVYKLYPNVDPSGCGNTSSAVIMYSLNEKDDPITALAKAALAASENAKEYGLVKLIDDKMKNEIKEKLAYVKASVVKIDI